MALIAVPVDAPDDAPEHYREGKRAEHWREQGADYEKPAERHEDERHDPKFIVSPHVPDDTPEAWGTASGGIHFSVRRG